MNIIRTAILGLTLVAFASFDCMPNSFLTSRASAQILGLPAAKKGEAQWKNVLAAFPEEEPFAIFAWGKAGGLNPTGNPSEQWFAKEELQTMFKKIKTTLLDVSAKTPDRNMALWLEGPLWKIFENGGMLAVEDFDFDAKRLDFSFVSYKYDGDSIKELLNKFGVEDEYSEEKIGEEVVYEAIGNRTLVLGFHGDYLVATSTKASWKKVAYRIDAGQRAPDWARKRFANQPIRRLSSFGFANIAKLKEQMASANEQFFAEGVVTLERLGIESLEIKQGTDDISNIAIVQVVGDKAGLLSSIDATPLTVDQLKAIPNDCTVALGVKLSPENIIQLIKKFNPGQAFDEMEPMVAFERKYGVNLKTDFIDLLEGDLRGFSSGSIIKPLLIGVVGIKDPKAFQETLKVINSKAEEQADYIGGEFVEKTGRDGVTVYGFKPPVGTSFYWAVHESELLFGSNSRAIGSFLRKRATRETSLVDQPLIAEILKTPPPESLGPVAVQVIDVNQIAEALIPMASLALNFIRPDSGIDISADDIPSPEVFAGLRPNAMIGFKTADGATMISRYDTPVSLESSYGVMLGMMLPAIQQVRAAARRTATLNNFRQVALAAFNFESANQSFPTAFSVDEDDNEKRLLSWRVHLLPYLGEQELYEEFHLDEPWDSVHNIKLLKQMPKVFDSPSTVLEEGHTMMLAPVTEASTITQSPKDGNEGTTFGDITDGSSNTIMLIEGGKNNAVPWTAPQDLEMAKLKDANFDTGHPGVFCAAFSDGSTHAVSKTIDIERLVGGCVINDGKTFDTWK